MSRIPELQAAVRALEGIAQATLRWPEPHGPAVLRVEFDEGADRQKVTSDILEAVADVGEVDLSSLRVEATPTELPVRATRPVFSGLSVQRTDLDSTVSVTLGYEGRTATATVEGLATRRAAPRTAASAALTALREFLPRDVRVQLEWLEVAEAATPGRPELVHAAVTCLTNSGEETFVGTAIVRGDLREAAVRATLDALNRRFERFAAAS